MDTTEDKPKETTPVEAKEKAEVPEDVPEINEEELSDEDRQLKTDLELLVDRLEDQDASLHKPALESLRTHIRTATSSMTSVPKPLKFLRTHYDRIKAVYDTITDAENKALTADVVSLLAMTFEDKERDCLNFRFKGSSESLAPWGHEYVRHLQGEIAQEFQSRQADSEEPQVDDLFQLAAEIVPYCLSHNAEADACDLLMEIERMDMLEGEVDEDGHQRVCLYLLSCVPYVAEPEDSILLKTCLTLYRKHNSWPQAMQMALRLNDMDTIKAVFKDCTDKIVRRQLAFMLGRQQFFFDVEEELEDIEDDDDELEQLRDLMANTFLNESFLALGRELDIVEAKSPEDVYKNEDERTSTHANSARGNLAATFVNAFINAGFGMDKLILGSDQGSKWMYKNKERGIMAAAASLGLILLWDVDGGLTRIDPFIESDNEFIKAGALLGIGIVNSTVRNEHEPALALLSDYVNHKKSLYQVGSIMGLGLAYAGTSHETVEELLLPVLDESSANMEVLATTALALGQVHAGTANGDVAEALVQCMLMQEEDKLMHEPYARFLPLALGLIYLGKQQQAEVIIATLETLPGPFGKIAKIVVETCAYAGTGNVLKIQDLLHECSEHFDTDKEGAAMADVHQGYAVVGIAMIAMGEDISVDMALRSMNHLLQYGEPVIRRAVPVAMALLCVSNPDLSVLDILSKLSHDADPEVAYNAILAMGVLGAGTNQARVAGMLRHLAQYYAKDADTLFVVRIAQGLLYTGKGSMTLSPIHTERTLSSPPAMAGLFTFLLGLLDAKNVLLKDGHYHLYHLSLAMYPRILSTFDQELKPLSVSVRVGQAVDVVGQAGKPKTITGFTTNNTPVLLGYGERAQLATTEYKSVTPILEGFVIIQKADEQEE
eukprot:TRINITY_DN6813_c0_g1_i1.p1 TRINITY_DN6813_c0_g1~~TRINITY_DN6813_c0_g1_i1.p1  ORF type:complete len:889 (+),score=302.50 TRINITY_DN6813_c0_g1_i1:154-2820(+)